MTGSLRSAKILTIAIIGLALTGVAVSLGSAKTASTGPVKAAVIDTAGLVQISQCTLCHFRLDDFQNERLIFSHNDHFLSGIGCPACHTAFPHYQDKTARPQMQVCLTCHNLHGDLLQAMQTDCRECHPPTMELRPAFHISGQWTDDLHAQAAIKDVSYCLMCHKQQKCLDCHRERGIKERPESFYKKQMAVPDAAPPAAVIDSKAQINISSCQYCHANIEDFVNPGLIFNHQAHFAKGVKCFSCHNEWPHTRAGTKKPAMDLCYGCHGLTHAASGVIAPENCDLCHPVGFNLKPNSHTAEFISSQHKKVVEDSYFTCMTCHDDREFCAPCHTKMNVAPKSHKAPATGVVLAASNSDWQRSHGQNIDYAYCDLCHDQDFCTRCHRTPMPHNILYVATHKDFARGMRQECAICHKDESTCSDCHHKFEQREILTAASCSKCHEEVNRPLLEVGSKGLMVHRAHFEMTNTAPFACNKCHAASYSQDKRCFQFELCYSCHGRYRADKLIAKWPGSQLCYRCHPQNR